MRWLLLLLITGCFIEKKQDAPDLTCGGVPPPERAPQSLRVDGVARSLSGDMGLRDITIQGFASGIALSETETTDAEGRFSFSHDSSGVPNNDSIQASGMGLLTTTAYPGKPVFEDSFVEIRMLPVDTVQSLAIQAEIPFNPDLGMALVRISDCNESPVAGGTIDRRVDGSEVYYFKLLSPVIDATETDASGLVLILNLPIAKTTISGSIGDVRLFDNEITITSDLRTSFVQTLARP